MLPDRFIARLPCCRTDCSGWHHTAAHPLRRGHTDSLYTLHEIDVNRLTEERTNPPFYTVCPPRRFARRTRWLSARLLSVWPGRNSGQPGEFPAQCPPRTLRFPVPGGLKEASQTDTFYPSAYLVRLANLFRVPRGDHPFVLQHYTLQ